MPDLLDLMHELEAALPGRLNGIDNRGVISWKTPPTVQEMNTAEAVKAAHNPTQIEADRKAERAAVRAAIAKLEDPATTAGEWRIQATKAIKYLLRELKD